ncbi:MAG: 3-oxoacyl-ACP synthase [Treponema sp.]|nr:3-oxoacyl-ACP synthase [Treponema sp.]
MDLYLSKPGVMSCAGASIEELWASVICGNQNGIKKVKACTGEEFFAARIDDSLLKTSGARYDMKIIRIENAALEQISPFIEAASARYGADRIAVCVGSCDNGTEFSLAGHRRFFAEGSFPPEYDIEMQGADYVATFVKEKFNLRGPCSAFSTACSSSAGAIIKAAELILGGLADAAVVGGVDIASDTTLVGFNSLEAVSDEITNPFSKNRHGITLGDGAAFFVLSREALEAAGREQDVQVKLLGWGESADAYHATSPDPSGAGAEKAIRRALQHSGIQACDVGYINMHGTGTKLNDSMESKAIDAVFGKSADSYAGVAVSTTKPVTGHTLGAAAALELAVCWAALVENYGKTCDNIKLPLQVWDGIQDEELPALNIVDSKNPSGSADLLKVCLSNSFAFGGANACLAIGLAH